jgi:Cu-processing system permease protein
MNTCCESRREEALILPQQRSAPRHPGSCDFSRQIILLAGKEFSDRFSSGWVIACVAVWLGAIGLTSLFGLVQIGQIGWQGYERTVISLLNLVQYLVPLLGLLLGHDLIVSEREERTLSLLLATGLSRSRLLVGKFLGGCLTLALPLVLGFVIAGTAIGLAAKDSAIKPFLTLAASGLILGFIFLAIGLFISIFCRTRVQSLVFALLTWCMAIFVFDLVALGVLISTKAPQAAQEIDAACDTMHLNAATDIHAAFDAPQKAENLTAEKKSGFTWLFLNPVDLFRAVNLSKQMNLNVPPLAVAGTAATWLITCLTLGAWKLRRLDL